MNRLTFAFFPGLVAAGLIFSPARAQQGSYTVKGKAPAAVVDPASAGQRRMMGMPTPGKIYLHRYTIEDGAHTDSVAVGADGSFTFTGTVKAPETGQLIFMVGKSSHGVVFYLEPGTIHIDCKVDGEHFSLSGTALNRDLEVFNGFFNAIMDSVHVADSTVTPWSKEGQAYRAIAIRRFVALHPSSAVGLDQIDQVAIAGVDADLVDTLFHMLRVDIQKTPKGIMVAQRVTGMHSGAIGSAAPAFTLQDTSGRKVSLSDFKGKYVLIDFWATWCEPCLEEMPNVIKAYQKYKDQNFVIVGISLDRPDTKALWKKDIVNMHMDWVQISDLKWWNSTAALAYNINGVPANFLVDPNGKIVAKDLRGEALQTKLSELFKL